MSLTPVREQLYDAVTNINDQYISEALSEKSPPRQKTFIRIVAMAACLILIFTLPFLIEEFAHPITAMVLLEGSPFRTTVSASDGTSLSLNEKIINYITRNTWEEIPHFGDHTTFLLSFTPTEWDHEGSLESKYCVYVEYNGTPAGHPLYDEHVMLTELSDRFDILGWFDEPTDLVVTFVLCDTDQIVQTQTIHIEFDKTTETYSFSAKEVIDYTQGG